MRLFRRFIYILALLVAVPSTGFSQDLGNGSVPDINVYIYESPPYSILLPDGSVEGEWVSKIRAFLDQTGLGYEINIVTWNRALEELAKHDNVLIASLDRTAEREESFHWLLPIGAVTYSVVARNEPEFVGMTFGDVLAHDGQILCIAGRSHCQILRNIGFPEEKIQRVENFDQLMFSELLARGRADFILDNFGKLEYLPERTGATTARYLPLFDIISISAYLAAGKSINPELLERLLGIPISETN
jgi:polar amino acid transport system substrate-binding protein